MWYILLFMSTILYVHVKGTLDISISKYGMCEGTENTPIQYHANFTKINSTITLADGSAKLPVSIGDDVMLDCIIEVYRNNEWEVLYNLTNKSPCTVLNKYGGELFFDIERHFNFTPGGCPFPKGIYEAKNYVVDFTKLPITYAPKAVLRSTAHMIKKDDLLLCFYGEFEIL